MICNLCKALIETNIVIAYLGIFIASIGLFLGGLVIVISRIEGYSWYNILFTDKIWETSQKQSIGNKRLKN